MAIEKIGIDEFLKRAEKYPVLDVRSPGEYQHAHIPGATSFPLFSDEERKVVGTLYKQRSRQEAIKAGLDFFGPNMRRMVEKAEQLVSTQNKNEPPVLLVHCWRGGMRSGAVAWLLDLYGFKIYTLDGGYKKFRNYVLNTFTQPLPVQMIGGYTGSGKTEVLLALEKAGERIIDLEDIAKHKGSAFGNINMPTQPTQEMFENLMAMRIRQLADQPDPIWVEDESQRIGLVNIPDGFWQNMRSTPIFFLDIPFEERLDHIVTEYGGLDRVRMHDAILRIQKRLGPLETKQALLYLEQDDMRACFRILLKYYDKYYHRGLHNRENVEALLQVIPCTQVEPGNMQKLLTQSRIHENT